MANNSKNLVSNEKNNLIENTTKNTEISPVNNAKINNSGSNLNNSGSNSNNSGSNLNNSGSNSNNSGSNSNNSGSNSNNLSSNSTKKNTHQNKPRNIDKLIGHIRYLLKNYKQSDKNYIDKHNEVIELFNSLRAVVIELEKKSVKEKRYIKKLVDIIRKTKNNRLLTRGKRLHLKHVQNDIMKEHENLKQSLKDIGIDINGAIERVKKDNKYKLYDPSKRTTHVKHHDRRTKHKKVRVKSFNRLLK